MRIIGVIPARMASSRFPGKPLAKIGSVPMIGHVYFRSLMSKAMDDVYIATCDGAIRAYANQIGAKCVMTANTHERATERTGEALLKVEQDTRRKVDIVVMIQGDEPMLRAEMIDEAIAPMLNDASINVVNLMSPLKNQEEHDDPNEVKVVVDGAGYALYFSREPIPSRKKGATILPMYKQVCVIPFRRDFLMRFNALHSTPLEVAESIDMLRVLEQGEKVKMIETKYSTYSVDTEDDLRRVEHLMRDDKLVPRYQLPGSPQ